MREIELMRLREELTADETFTKYARLIKITRAPIERVTRNVSLKLNRPLGDPHSTSFIPRFGRCLKTGCLMRTLRSFGLPLILIMSHLSV